MTAFIELCYLVSEAYTEILRGTRLLITRRGRGGGDGGGERSVEKSRNQLRRNSCYVRLSFLAVERVGGTV